jgi:hypothetical protein
MRIDERFRTLIKDLVVLDNTVISKDNLSVGIPFKDLISSDIKQLLVNEGIDEVILNNFINKYTICWDAIDGSYRCDIGKSQAFLGNREEYVLYNLITICIYFIENHLEL